jgi:glyoxylase-like metal-dependent hydrolase (beta-lactamase superfamily II)
VSAPQLKVAQFVTDNNEANCWVVACAATRQAMVVDVPSADPRIFRYLDAHGLCLAGVFVTHAHYDHTDGLESLLSTRPVTVYAAASLPGGIRAVRVKAEHEIVLGAVRGRVVETPGHTPDSVSLVLPGAVFTGDALFAGSIGGTACDRDKQREISSVRERILSLSEDWLLCPGHGPSSTVGVEWRFNPFFNPPRK